MNEAYEVDMDQGGGVVASAVRGSAYSRFTYGLLVMFVVVLVGAALLSARIDWLGSLQARMAGAQSAALAAEDQVTQTLQLVENVVRTLEYAQDRSAHPETKPEKPDARGAQKKAAAAAAAAARAVSANDLERLLQRMQYSLPAIRSLSVIDAKGRIQASSDAKNQGVVLDTTRFSSNAAALAGASRLQVAEPWLGRDFSDGKPIDGNAKTTADQSFFVPVLLPLSDQSSDSGPWAVVVAINPEYLMARVSRYVHAQEEMLSVVLRSGRYLFSTKDPMAGQIYPLDEWWKTQTTLSAVHDTGAQVVAGRGSSRYPIYVTVEVERGAIWAQWLQQKLSFFLWIGGAIFAALLACGLLLFKARAAEKRQINQQAEAFKLSQALEQSPNGVVIVNLVGVVEHCNSSFARMRNQAVSEIVGHVVQAMDVRRVSPQAVDELRRTLALGRLWRDELVHERGHSASIDVAVVWCGLRNDQGKLTHFMGVEHDITALKQLHRDLSQERDRAQTATRVKSEFLSNMSHEIRTPMSGMIGMAALALDEPMSDKAREFVTHSHTSAMNLLGILNDILDFSKMEAGKLQVEDARFEVRPWLESLARLHMLEASGKGLALHVKIRSNVPTWLVSDALRLSQVLNNLLSNAIKFTSSGSVSVDVRTEPVEGQSGRCKLTFEVTDTGCGISTEEIDRLFMPFSQANTSTSRVYGGTGLGLVISRRLCEALGGTIQVKSQPQMGSTFLASALVGAVEVESEDIMPALNRIHVPESRYRPIGEMSKLRVLLVEDHPFNRQMMAAMLAKFGVTAQMVVNGQEAVYMLERPEPHFDLILMDIQMPIMDGVEATRRIRRMAHRAHVPVVAVTANALKDEKELCFAVGMQDYLVKPVDMPLLQDKLCQWGLPELLKSGGGETGGR